MSEQYVIHGIHYTTEMPVEVRVKDGLISSVSAYHSVKGKQGEPLLWIAPGLIDLQINGYKGYDYNTLPLDSDLPDKVTVELWKQGISSYCPTIITNSDEAIEKAVSTVAAACDRNPLVEATIAGIHLEGPFISPEDGPRGAHDRQYVKAPDWELFKRWQKAAGQRIRILTLSPEWPEAPEFITKCVRSGVKVSIGHTNANTEQISAAVEAGATMSTHLGNGAHVMLPRHPNYIWDQLAEDRLWAGIICDGFHLPMSVVKSFIRGKLGKSFMVSDVAYLSGMEPGRYTTLIGGNVVLSPEGRLYLADNPELLAASVQLQISGIGNLVRSGVLTLPQAWDMASAKPAAFLNLPQQAGLTVGAPADIVLFAWTGEGLQVFETRKQGEVVYTCKNK